jgi:solute carrier family 29 (equilibrative nucleoside transporter), member 1/2/3
VARRGTGIYNFLLFNVGDWSGRILAGWVNDYLMAQDGRPLFAGFKTRALIAARTGFIPLFMLCNHACQPSVDDTGCKDFSKDYQFTRKDWPVAFRHDAWPVLFMVVFSVSNGYCGTACMMSAPQLVPPAAGKQAGTIMASCLVIGIAVGSVASFFLTFVYTGKSPFESANASDESGSDGFGC